MNIIYTAIFGDYDKLQEPLHVIPGVRYICYTDQVLNSKVWELIMIKPKYDSVRQAREIKILFHQYMPFFTKAIWIDANQQIKTDISFLFGLDDRPLTLLNHPDRNCIYTEALECMRLKKDNNDVINNQIVEYIQKGFPINMGLVATGLMMRKNDAEINKFCKLWFEEVKNGSRRDQLSFNYVLWKNKIFYETIPFETLKNNFIRCNHNK